jgi:hypothetical protein
VVFFFFQKKKQKALFRFAEDPAMPKNLGEADSGCLGARINHHCQVSFFFQKKKQKALFCFAEGSVAQPSAKPTQGGWGLAPKKPTIIVRFSSSDKEAGSQTRVGNFRPGNNKGY